MIGRTLSQYRILAKIGSGGMGEVYRAEDLTLNREAALEVLPPGLAESDVSEVLLAARWRRFVISGFVGLHRRLGPPF
jgi:serine/threonine protein kinase